MSLDKGLQALEELEQQILQENDEAKKAELTRSKEALYQETFTNLSAYDRVKLARDVNRPNVEDFISHLFDDFMELHGDRGGMDDRAVIGGLAFFRGRPVTVVGHRKGHTTQQNIEARFGMASPEGYRKALRLMEQANKFHRPIICFVDTPGAYPGDEAEMHGQGEAIARCLREMFLLEVPIITIVIGEGGSGGALAFSIADRIVMLENAAYSVLSPEGFASILYKDASKANEVCELMKMTARDLYELKIADHLIREPLGSLSRHEGRVYVELSHYLQETLDELTKMKKDDLLEARYAKFRRIGQMKS